METHSFSGAGGASTFDSPSCAQSKDALSRERVLSDVVQSSDAISNNVIQNGALLTDTVLTSAVAKSTAPGDTVSRLQRGIRHEAIADASILSRSASEEGAGFECRRWARSDMRVYREAAGMTLSNVRQALEQLQSGGKQAFSGWKSPWIEEPSEAMDEEEELSTQRAGMGGASSVGFALQVALFPASAFRVLSWEGVEEVSRPYAFEITVSSSLFDLELVDCLGKSAQLKLFHPQGCRWICGVIEQAEQLEVGIRQSFYQFRVVPLLALSGHTRRSRIFRGLSTPDIVHWVLAGAGYPKERIRSSLLVEYPPRDYCVQYQESDLALISRLLEEEGIFFFFEHTPEGEVLILADSDHVHPHLPETPVLNFRDPQTLKQLAEPAIHRFQVQAGVGAGKVTLRDYRFKQPALDLTVQADARQAELPGDSSLEVFCFPGEYVDPRIGERLARVRLEGLACQQRRVSGLASAFTLQPGYSFHLEQHPRSDYNREYLLVKVVHKGSQPQALEEEVAVVQEEGTYEARWEGIPAELPFRPLRSTPRPVIPGLQSARVEAAGSEDIHCDVWGRVLVRFMWEGLGGSAEQLSCWVRVSQGWAGRGFGTFFLPRAGQEVLVQFLEGDPDRPVIVGRVHNEAQRTPYVLPAQKACSGIRTQSTPGGEGYNELRFDDLSGKEEVKLRAQRDWNIEVLRTQTASIGQDVRTTVGRDLSLEVTRDDQRIVRGQRSDIVQGKEQRRIDASQTVQIRADRLTTLLEGSDLLRVESGAREEVVQADRTVWVRKGHHRTLVSEGSQITSVGGAREAVVDGPFDRTRVTAGFSSLEVAGDRRVEVQTGDHATVVASGRADVSAAAGIGLSTDQGSIVLSTQQDLQCDAQGRTVIKAQEVVIEAASALVLKVGASELHITCEGISLHGPTVTGAALGALTLQGVPITLN